MSSNETDDGKDAPAQPLTAKSVNYCPVCTLPLEYCEYSPTWDQCRANLEQVDPELLAKLSALRIASGKTEGKSEAKAEGGSTDGGDGTTGKAKKDGEEGSDEDEAEEAPAKPAAGAGKAKQEIHLVVKERTRRKFITIVKGVETCGLVAKEVAKLMAKKFATSASPGEDGIQLNGDLANEIYEFLVDSFPKDVPQNCVTITTAKGNKIKPK